MVNSAITRVNSKKTKTMEKAAATGATIVIDDSSSGGSGEDGGEEPRRVSSVAGRHAHHASTGRGRPTHLASSDDCGGMGHMIDRVSAAAAGRRSPLRLPPQACAPFFSDYQDAVKTALAMVASLAGAASAGADTSGVESHNSGLRSEGEGAMKRTTKKKKKKKKHEVATRASRLSKTTVDTKARKRPLVKNSRAWTAASDGKSVVQVEPQRPRPHSESARRHQSNLSSSTTSGYSKSIARAPVRSHSGSHSSDSAMARSSKTSPGSATLKSKESSGLHHTAARKVASRLSYGAQKSQQQRDLIEISSSSLDSPSDEGSGSSSGDSSSSSGSSARSFRSHKMRRVDGQSSFANTRGAGKVKRTSKSAIIKQQDTAAYKQKKASKKTAGKQASQSQQISRQQREFSQQTQELTQRRQLAPSAPATRPIPVSKKATRKTTVLNLSSSSQRTRRDSISSSSSSYASSYGSRSSEDLSKPRTLYYCKKSTPVSTSSAAVFRVQRAPKPSPPPPPASTLQRPSSPLATEEKAPKRQRRQTATRFHVDSVALDEVQAQERELARFEMEKRQRRSFEQMPFAAMKRAPQQPQQPHQPQVFVPWDGGRKAESRDVKHDFSDSDFQMIDATTARLTPARATRKTVVARPTSKTKQEARPASALQQPSPPATMSLRDDLSDSLNTCIARRLEERKTVTHRCIQMSVKENIAKRAKFLENLDTSRIVIHPTAYRGIRVASPPIQPMLSDDVLENCAPPFHSDCDVPLTVYGESLCAWLCVYCAALTMHCVLVSGM